MKYLSSRIPLTYRIYPYKRPGGGGGGGCIFQKGGLLLKIKKDQLSSPVAMGDNGHLQP